MLSAQQSAHCSVVRRPNPALSSLEERWRLLCFSILLGFWAWWVCPSHVWNFPFHWQRLICGMQDWNDANMRAPKCPYKVTISTERIKSECGIPLERKCILLQKTTRHSAQPQTAAEKHRCHCLSRDCARTCVCVCVCLQLLVSAQMPLFEVSLKCVPDHQLALPYLPTAMPPQLASNQYLLWPATNCYELLSHLCSST